MPQCLEVFSGMGGLTGRGNALEPLRKVGTLGEWVWEAHAGQSHSSIEAFHDIGGGVASGVEEIDAAVFNERTGHHDGLLFEADALAVAGVVDNPAGDQVVQSAVGRQLVGEISALHLKQTFEYPDVENQSPCAAFLLGLFESDDLGLDDAASGAKATAGLERDVLGVDAVLDACLANAAADRFEGRSPWSALSR